VIFKGEIVTGVKTATYKVPALQPGQYPFLCTVHPTMTGTATVQ
jgi:plastocyanin